MSNFILLFQHSIVFNEHYLHCPDAEILVYVLVCMRLFYYWSTTDVINVRDIFNCVYTVTHHKIQKKEYIYNSQYIAIRILKEYCVQNE